MIKLHACGVNPVDTYIRSGAYGKLPQLPYIPGKDGAGVVISVGSEVEGISEGDRVYLFNSTTGTYAENCICNASNIFKLPSNISFSQGACLGTPAFTAYRALFQKAQAKPGELIFVHGASGGVGLMVVEMAKAAGMKVVGAAGTPEGIEVIFEYFYPVKSKAFIALIL
jgi:NADPH2:quinone reductase